ncbi:MAG: ATP synthase subunit I [Zoogloeaceae bacterium]|nr:ATP synthase subunit I [Zoogloeaceae bacterium]
MTKDIETRRLHDISALSRSCGALARFMLRVVVWQFCAALPAVGLAALFAGTRGALSAALAFAACALPTLWLALRLARMAKRPEGVRAEQFFIGEFVKVAATLALLVAIVKIWPGVHWPSLLLGMVMVLQANFFAFLKKT